MFTKNDLLQIQSKGITIDTITKQIDTFKKGFPFLNVSKSATINDGIISLTSEQVDALKQEYSVKSKKHTISKFVPASGAATRMFKSLYEYVAEPTAIYEEVHKFITNINSFAFYNDLKNKSLENNLSLENLIKTNQITEIINLLLLPTGLNYGNLPKGLLKFHKYEDNSRVPIEEHLVEGALYGTNEKKEVNIHFTLSPEHIQAFNQLISSVIDKYSKLFKINYHITFSIQKPSTDTIAVDDFNNPFREKDGKLIFRPGGHGALLENLNEQNADIQFIKNIDNVVPDRLKPETTRYKMALAGLLLQNKETIDDYLLKLSKNLISDNEQVFEIKSYIETNLGYYFPDNFTKLELDEKRQKLFQILNRPIRVCGMVKNLGEPGGGPFWVKARDGSLSLQILETSQFDLDNEAQRTIFKSATYFNPVDLIVYTKDYKGNKFDLTNFTDPETGFISIKSKDGKELKALELPGLWNGAMANWNTIFVEVPIITFNPVKTLSDLLRDEHREG
jgi:hypothetical protein